MRKLFPVFILMFTCPAYGQIVSSNISLPATLTAPGVWTNTQQNENFSVIAGSGCSPSSIFSRTQAGNFTTDGLSGTVCTPSSQSNTYSSGVAGYAAVSTPNGQGPFGDSGGVGVSGTCLALVTGANCWGLVSVVQSTSGDAAALLGEEIDVAPANSSDTGWGFYMALSNPSSGNTQIGGIELNTTSSNQWAYGLKFTRGSIAFASAGVNPAIVLEPGASSGSEASQSIIFTAQNSGGTQVPIGLQSQVDANGNPFISTDDATNGYLSVWLRTGEIEAQGTNSLSGCSLTNSIGGSWAGSFKSGTTGTCTVTITGQITAVNGWACRAQDLTTPTDSVNQTAYTTTTATLSGTTVSGDLISWLCMAF